MQLQFFEGVALAKLFQTKDYSLQTIIVDMATFKHIHQLNTIILQMAFGQ